MLDARRDISCKLEIIVVLSIFESCRTFLRFVRGLVLPFHIYCAVTSLWLWNKWLTPARFSHTKPPAKDKLQSPWVSVESISSSSYSFFYVYLTRWVVFKLHASALWEPPTLSTGELQLVCYLVSCSLNYCSSSVTLSIFWFDTFEKWDIFFSTILSVPSSSTLPGALTQPCHLYLQIHFFIPCSDDLLHLVLWLWRSNLTHPIIPHQKLLTVLKYI